MFPSDVFLEIGGPRKRSLAEQTAERFYLIVHLPNMSLKVAEPGFGDGERAVGTLEFRQRAGATGATRTKVSSWGFVECGNRV